MEMTVEDPPNKRMRGMGDQNSCDESSLAIAEIVMDPSGVEIEPETGIGIGVHVLDRDIILNSSGGNGDSGVSLSVTVTGMTQKQKQNDKWLERLEELRSFCSTHGDCLVPRNYVINPGLGAWVHNQRTQYKLLTEGKHSRITEERVELLQALGFVWNTREMMPLIENEHGEKQRLPRRRKPQDDKWLRRLHELKAYISLRGNTLVPQSYAANPALGKWVSYQRTQYKLLKEGKPSQMSEERIASLEEVSFAWTVKSLEEQVPWEERLSQLREYKAEYGHCLVPRSYSASPQLGAWVHYQRQQYRLLQKGKRSQMTQERVHLLNSEDFVWNVQGHRPWEERLEELRAFKSQHGSCLVPVKYSPNPQLGNWVHNQRKEYKSLQEKKKSALTQDRIRVLELEGFVWDTRHTAHVNNNTGHSCNSAAHTIARAHAHIHAPPPPPLYINACIQSSQPSHGQQELSQAVAMTMHDNSADSEVPIMACVDRDAPSFGPTGSTVVTKDDQVEYYANV